MIYGIYGYRQIPSSTCYPFGHQKCNREHFYVIISRKHFDAEHFKIWSSHMVPELLYLSSKCNKGHT